MPGCLLHPQRQPRWLGVNHEAFSILVFATIVARLARNVKGSTKSGDGERGH